MEIDLHKEPATLADMVLVMNAVIVEMMRHAALTSAVADQVLTTIANDLDEMSRGVPDNPRAALILRAMSAQLMATE